MNGNRSVTAPIDLHKVRKNGHAPVRSEADRLLDDVGWRILVELQEDGRVPFAELGRRVGLSTPAVIERVRRLEEAGIITGYHAAVDPARIGRGIVAVVRVQARPGETSASLGRVLANCPEVVEAHHITGDDCFSCKIHVGSVGELEHVIGELAQHGRTTTSIVLSSPVARRSFGPIEA
jgi:Lrp/AsnC family transcriptional regulator, leucine-responsive regulatory protein